MRLSVIIPSYKDPLSERTVDALLSASELGDRLEVVVVWDGYYPEWPLHADPRVRYVHNGQNVGMRESINRGIAVSRGEFVARSDEHCKFAPGFDRALTDACRPDWIITARRYALDPTAWEVMDSVPAVDYERLVVQTVGKAKKWTGLPWPERGVGREGLVVDRTQGFQGSFWLMSRAWWDKVVGPLQTEGYGPHYQDSHEMAFKTWRAGGEVCVHKGTWFAHKHVSFPRTHNLSHGKSQTELQYAYDTWVGYYRRLKRRWDRAARAPDEAREVAVG